MSDRPAVSVIINAYGRRRRLFERSLWLLDHQTYGPVEVVIADDGGEDLSDLADGHNYVRVRPAGSEPRPGNMALRVAYEIAGGDFIITSSPETMVPPNAVERMIAQHQRGRRSVPVLYCLDRSHTNRLEREEFWKADLHALQGLPGFWSAAGPHGQNLGAAGVAHHMQFSGQFREEWELTGFLPPTDEYGKYDESWLREQEVAAGQPPRQIGLVVYHQWHERLFPVASPASARIGRIREAE